MRQLVETLVLAADREQEVDAQVGGEVLAGGDHRLGPGQQIADRERPPRGRGVGEQERVELAGGPRARQLAPGAVALLGRERGLSPRLPGLDDGARDARRKRDDCRCGQRDRQPVSAHELGRAVGGGLGACRDGPVLEVAPELVAHREHRGIALFGALAKRFGDDRLEVAGQEPAQALRGRATQRGNLGDRPLERGAAPRHRPSAAGIAHHGVREAWRIGFDDCPHEVGGRLRGRVVGKAPGQHQIEQPSERVDVRRGRDEASGELLGRGEGGRERPAGVPGEGGRLPRLPLALEELGDAEIEELRLAAARHEHVRRLQVPVHDQARVRVGHGVEHVEKEADARRDVEPLAVAVPVDRFALDVLEDEVGLATRRDPGVDQVGDVRMGEPREDRPLASETRFAGPSEEGERQELHRGDPFESPVASPRQPDRSHPSLAERRLERVGAEPLTGECRVGGLGVEGSREKAVGFEAIEIGERGVELVGERGVVRTHSRDLPGAIRPSELEESIEL